MPLPKIIGATGRAGAGKDTFCNMAAALLAHADIRTNTIACADPLKKICADVYNTAYGVPLKHFYGTQDDKQLSLQYYGLEDWSGRKILQYIGTEGFRHVSPEVWSRYMISNAKSSLDKGATVVFVSDVRFLSEAKAIQDNDGIIVRVRRPEADALYENQGIQGHASEVELATIQEDFVLDNQGRPLHDLESLIQGLLCQLGFLVSTPKQQA